MKHDKLANALGEIGDQYINEAAAPAKRRTWHWAGAIAAVLAVAVTVTAVMLPAAAPQSPAEPPAATMPPGAAPGTATAKFLAAGPVYPQMAPYPTDINDTDSVDAWYQNRRAQYSQPPGFGDNLYDFYTRSIPLFLNSGTQNSVCSPVNVYMALSMLAETTDGNTRQQILDALNADSMDALRQQAGYMWNAHYCDDNATKLLLANSLWLDSTLPYSEDTAGTLAESYYASVYHGDLGSEALNRELQQWLDQNTGGFLQEQTRDIELDDRTLLALASTIYYKVKWSNEFSQENNIRDVFHAPDGDRTVTYMKDTLYYGPYYYGEGYSAVSLPLEDHSRMWLILPDEGLTPQDILESGQALQDLLVSGEPQNFTSIIVHLQLPKFDVASTSDLKDGLQALGITDAFSPEDADFASISSEPLFVSRVDHGARVKIDEKGLEAAAYTVMPVNGAGMPPEEEVDFVLDRPFLFMIESRSGMPLFTGVVNQP